MRQILWPKVSTYPSVVDENLREEVLLFINDRISIALLLALVLSRLRRMDERTDLVTY